MKKIRTLSITMASLLYFNLLGKTDPSTRMSAIQNIKQSNALEAYKVTPTLHTDSEVLDKFKTLFISYTNKVKQAKYAEQIADELRAKAEQYRAHAESLKKESEQLLAFLQTQMETYHNVKKQALEIRDAKTLHEASDNNTDNQSVQVENFIHKIASEYQSNTK